MTRPIPDWVPPAWLIQALLEMRRDPQDHRERPVLYAPIPEFDEPKGILVIEPDQEDPRICLSL